MGQFEYNNYFKVGSFRVHGPYKTEAGQATKEFLFKAIKFEQAEKYLGYLIKEKYKDRDESFVIAYPIKPLNVEIVLATQSGEYDIGLKDLRDNTFRIDISQTEYDFLCKNICFYIDRFKAEYDHYIAVRNKSHETPTIGNNEEYSKIYNPLTKPMRKIAPNLKYNDLFER